MAHVFISYSRKDLEMARYVRSSLQNEGVAVWMDEQGIAVGDLWERNIQDALNHATAVVVLMSVHAEKSEWVERELHYADSLEIPIFPILISGKPFFRLINKQYEDMRLGLQARLSKEFVQRLKITLENSQPPRLLKIERGNVLTTEVDVFIMKHAGNFFGADLIVKEYLESRGVTIDVGELKKVGFLFVDTQGVIPAQRVLFVATNRLNKFDYADVRHFVSHALEILQEHAPDTVSIAMTIHGVGAGLDERETFLAQLGGVLDGLAQVSLDLLETITFIEIVERRHLRLRQIAEEYLQDINLAQPLIEGNEWGYVLLSEQRASNQSAPSQAVLPDSVLVFFPPQADLDDLYQFGVVRPIQMQGLLCENVGIALDTRERDELDKLKRFIQRAKLVLVYAETVSPSLALQLGMVLGMDKPLVCLSRHASSDTSPLPNALCVQYTSIMDLERHILNLLKAHEG
jgi:hypothetical protein